MYWREGASHEQACLAKTGQIKTRRVGQGA